MTWLPTWRQCPALLQWKLKRQHGLHNICRGGASIFPQVSEIAQQMHWPISEFHIERGQLEDVFRSVTQQSEGQTDE